MLRAGRFPNQDKPGVGTTRAGREAAGGVGAGHDRTAFLQWRAAVRPRSCTGSGLEARFLPFV